MDKLSVHIVISDALYTKDPESSDLGRNIISKSIEMINELGYESFTFKKLGIVIGSNESSIYRYFSSKHALLIYLISWYWSWVEYKLVFATTNMATPEERLREAIRIVTENVTEDQAFSNINEVLLHNIIISESSKAYYTKDVDTENKKGYFKTYKRVVQRASDMVLAVNSKFKFPHMLISTVIEGAHHQRYYATHLPSLTDAEKGKNTVVTFYTDLVLKTISE